MKIFEIISILTFTITKWIPKKKNLWVFGSWFGRSQSDNSKAFSDYVNKIDKSIQIVWIVNDLSEYALDYGKPIKRNSIKSLRYLCRAEVAVMNQGFGDLAAYNFLGGCYKVQLTHGVGWKKFAKDTLKLTGSFKDRLYLKCFDYLNTYDLYVTPSENQISVMKSSLNAKDDNIIRCGQPRNEVLFSEVYLENCKKVIKKKLGIDEETKLIVYMPTFRDNTEEVFSFADPSIRDELLRSERENGFVVLEKPHPVSFERLRNKYLELNEGVLFVPNEKAEVMLAAADVLITDYSSCFFDYLILDRPIIHYLYDYEYYVNSDRGVYYDLMDVVAGDTPKTIQELLTSIAENLKNPELNHDLRNKRKGEFITYESEANSKIIYERIMEDRKKK